MRLRRLRGNSWAAWLGVAALVLNALVPVHLAFDLAEALAPGNAAPVGSGWRLLAKIVGHTAPAHQHEHGEHHPPDCPVCASLAALGGPAPAPPPALSAPALLAAAPELPPPAAPRAATAVAAYRSRAPPVL